jgi:hypothetical protein
VTEAEVIDAVCRHLEGLFPKVCPNCQRQFATLRDYLLNTQYLGPVMPYDADLGNWNPLRPIGTAAYASCRCGTTLALTSEGMPLLQLWALLNWARVETHKRDQSPQELLNYLRDEICKQVLAAPEPGGSGTDGEASI